MALRRAVSVFFCLVYHTTIIFSKKTFIHPSSVTTQVHLVAGADHSQHRAIRMVNPGQVSSSSQDVTNIFKEKQVSFYHDCVITIPHDDKTDFRLEFQVNHVSFHLYPCIVVWQFDTREKEKVLYISVQNYHRNKKYSCFWRKHSFLLTGCHSQ